MKENKIYQAVIYAKRLELAFELYDGFSERIACGDLHYSVVLPAQHAGVMVEIERNRSMFGAYVRVLEETEGVYVYHCLLTGPFLTCLYVPKAVNERETVGPIVGSDNVCAYILDLNELTWVKGTITIGSYDNVLIRLT